MYASVIGSNLGVLLTPLGALAGLMWMNILKNAEVELNFFSYIKHIWDNYDGCLIRSATFNVLNNRQY